MELNNLAYIKFVGNVNKVRTVANKIYVGPTLYNLEICSSFIICPNDKFHIPNSISFFNKSHKPQ
jgi:hypothetical protein